MTGLTLSNLSVYRGPCPVVEDISLNLHPGECVGLIGPNGAGKTTLMRAALGLLPHKGTSSLARLSTAERGRAAAWLPQMREIAWPVSVETLVGLGRTPHLGPGQRPGPRDAAAIAAALARMDLTDFAARRATALSGGEQARVLIARALAQEAPMLLADEPIAGLDPAHQITTMRLFADLAAEGRLVLAALHDLGLAARFCTRLILMQRGRLVADGPPAEVLTPDNLARVFGLRAYMADTPDGPVFQPLEVV
ncbi:ABC transporter ATP-binding protein [Rhodovulum adriaticum]|uniref:Iron complex transport system ATP-binding protein n=1 Tax=Rhodovulum adriaticum TaxID=35804 RepID=A0A4R2NV78_RHOAD|nr:ABC transporter ATP-binding protein [Rhodovulum adriaticum]MBK1635985.1 ABC transporter [Rhodovulum adriaticum]TCP25444.1 iron complex transport system ATP-binding protein [Rhodovulum adriaticum]